MATLREFAGGILGAAAGAVVGYYGLQGFGDSITHYLGDVSPYAHIRESIEYVRYGFQYGAPALMGALVGASLFRGRCEQNANNQPQIYQQNPASAQRPPGAVQQPPVIVQPRINVTNNVTIQNPNTVNQAQSPPAQNQNAGQTQNTP